MIGTGAMATSLVHGLDRLDRGPRIGALLARSPVPAGRFPGKALFHDVQALAGWQPDLLVECAGHGVVQEVLPGFLDQGVDVVIASIGALMDRELHDRLRGAAACGGARIILPSGAVGGLDALRAAALAGLTAVRYIGRKPPKAWKGSPAEAVADLDALTEPTIIFEGTAAKAARSYPKNANVAAAIALAGLGAEQTEVRLLADPSVCDNIHEIEAKGAFGQLSFQVANRPMPDNPRTSLLAALSVERAVLDHAALMAPRRSRETLA